MTEYIAKVILCQVILFLFYHFFLAQEKMHRFNRFYLIFSLLFSVIIPMMKIPAYFPTALDFSSIVYPEESLSVQQPIVAEPSSFHFSKWLILIYVMAFLFFAFRMIRNLFLINLISMHYKKTYYRGYQLILTENRVLPYSFLNRIFINREDYESGKISKGLLMHEIHHIRQHHSVDLIIAEIIQAVFWFNPILIFYNRAIRLNHEYLADHAVINNQVELSDYQQILVEAVSTKNTLPITSGFGATWTKKRLRMMTKERTIFSSSFKIILVIPILFLITASLIFSTETNESKTEREVMAIFDNYTNFYGIWKGSGNFFNCSLKKDVGEIPFQIVVNQDYTIEGAVGDATLYDINIRKVSYGIEIEALLTQPVNKNEIVNKDHIVIMWGLPEIEENRVDADFHLQKNFFLDPFLNAGGVILTKSVDKLHPQDNNNTEISNINK